MKKHINIITNLKGNIGNYIINNKCWENHEISGYVTNDIYKKYSQQKINLINEDGFVDEDCVIANISQSDAVLAIFPISSQHSDMQNLAIIKAHNLSKPLFVITKRDDINRAEKWLDYIYKENIKLCIVGELNDKFNTKDEEEIIIKKLLRYIEQDNDNAK